MYRSYSAPVHLKILSTLRQCRRMVVGHLRNSSRFRQSLSATSTDTSAGSDDNGGCVRYDVIVASSERTRFETHRGDQYDFDAWEKHESPFRNFRHLKYWVVSKTFRRILPNLLWLGGMSSGLSYYNSVIAPEAGTGIISFSALPLTLTGTALGLLLVLV